MVLRGRERQVADVEFEAFRFFSFPLSALFLVVVSITDTDATTVDAMTVEGFDGGVSHGLLGVGHEAKPTVHACIVGQHHAVGHVAVGLEQITEFIGPHLAGETPNEETGAWSSTLSSAATASAALAFETEVCPFSTVFADVGSNEGRTARGAFGEHGFGGSAPALAGVVQSTGTLIEFCPARTEVVGEGTVGLIPTRGALHVPITVEFGHKGVAAGRANRMEYATVITLSEIKADHGFNFFDDRSANISTTHCIRGLVHEAINQSGDKELAVEVLRLN